MLRKHLPTTDSLEEVMLSSPERLPKKRNVFADTASSADNSLTESRTTVIVEKVDIHQPVPLPRTQIQPQPMARKSMQNSLKSSSSDASSISENKVERIDSKIQIQKFEDDLGVQSISEKSYSVKEVKRKLIVEKEKENEEIISIKSDSLKIEKVIKSHRPLSVQYLVDDVIDTVQVINEKKLKKSNSITLVKPHTDSISDKESSESYTSSISEETETEQKKLKLIKEPKIGDKIREKRRKKSLSDEEGSDEKAYSYEKIIGVYLHHTSKLPFDYQIRTPMIRMSIMNIETGKLLQKSDANRNVVLNFEPKNVDFIQPIISRNCKFMNEQFIQCQWEELLVINEDINHILSGNEILFFELIDVLNPDQKNNAKEKVGWSYKAWAFLKPGNNKKSNIDKRCCLQMYRYRKKSGIQSVYFEWQLKRLKFPATLNVTVKAMKPIPNQNEIVSRPMHALHQDKLDQPDITIKNDIFQSQQKLNSSVNLTEDKHLDHSSLIDDQFIENVSDISKRLPGQSCQFPQFIQQKLIFDQSLVTKFCPNGCFLAIAHSKSSNAHEISITTIPNIKTIRKLHGHSGIIYDLDWSRKVTDKLFPQHLASVSSDRTCIFWTIERNTVSSKILPHPTFLYSVKVITRLNGQHYVVTGGRDFIIRIWKIMENSDIPNLHQELAGHNEFVTSILVSNVTKCIYSCDWSGFIVEWNIEGKTDKYQLQRKISIESNCIYGINFNPREDKLYAHNGHSVIFLDIESAIAYQTINWESNQNRRYKLSVSPCGSTIFTTNGSKIVSWNLLNGHEKQSIQLPFTTQKSFISSIDFHMKFNIMSVSVYGPNGGVFLLAAKNERNIENILTNSDVSKCISLKNQHHLVVNRKDQHNIKLNEIIRRVDEIFMGSTENQTDDHKFSEKLMQEAVGIEVTKDNDTRIDGKENCFGSSNSGSSTCSSENQTFTIIKKGDNMKQQEIENSKEDDSDSNDISNRTFILQKKSDVKNDGTYKIENENYNSDDTTISESL